LDHAPAASTPPEPLPSLSPLKFWKIEESFRCPVIGICLTPAEQKHLLRKAGVSIKNKSPYEIHELLVASAQSENPVSHKVDRLLNHKYGRCAAGLNLLEEPELIARWHAAFQTGHYLPEFWAAVSRADLSQEARKEIFAAIHMSMHANADHTARARRQLEQLKNEAIERESRVKRLQLGRKALQAEVEALKRRLAQANERLLCTEQEQSGRSIQPDKMKIRQRILELERENLHLVETLAGQTDQLKAKDRRLQMLAEEVARLTRELDAQKQAEAWLRNEAEGALRSFFETSRCDASCPEFNLCHKRVLIVGGIARMEALYRRLIESSGGVFEYHDGYLNGGAKHLENRLKRSDIVICPVNCNSHAACALVKNLGKKHNKPVHMLANFSLSAVTQVIRSCGTGEAAEN
jgi:hypothetical protein